MPKIVNHAERRAEVLDATWRVIAREGLEATTVRRIAEEAGHSNGVLQHYFKNKDDILISAHLLAFARTGERIARVTADRQGIEALRRAAFEALPLDEDGLLEAQVDVGFLGQVVGNDYLRTVRRESNEGARRQWTRFVHDAQALNEVPADLDVDLAVDELMALIDSLSVEAIIDPERMTAEHQMLLIDRFLDRIRS
jgi:AcrR family transcriptional regulator